MVRITRFLLPALILIVAFGVNFTNAQTVSFKNFESFLDIVPGVDFFASDRQMVTPYEAATAEAIAKLKTLLGNDLPKGAIFICSNQTQRDSLYEPVVFRQGYEWVLISASSGGRNQDMLDRIRSQMGDNIPEEFRQRMNEMMQQEPAASVVDPQALTTMSRNIAFAVLQVIMNADNEYFQFRASRADDVAKSPLQDWLDVAIGSYVSGDKSSVKYLQDNIDMMFPMDDVLIMPRPFVAPSTSSGGGQQGGRQGGGFPGGGDGGGFPGGDVSQIMAKIAAGGGQGGPGGGQGGPGGGQRPQGQQGAPKSKPDSGGAQQQRVLPKDEQDRLLFDGQAISFFDFFMEKFGIEKIRELIKFAGEGNESWDFVARPDLLGRDFSKIEAEWMEYLMIMSIPESKPKSNSESKPKSKVQQ